MASPDIAPPPAEFDLDVGTLIIGAGACGLTAALSAHEVGQDVLIVEAEPVPSGSTALSAGLIPAAGTRFQRECDINDSPALFAQDIQKKANNENDAALVSAFATASAEVIEWLVDQHGLPFSLVTDFDYPGHRRRRMHGLPSRSGAELIDALRTRIEALDIPVICERRAIRLFVEDDIVAGIMVVRPDNEVETIRCKRLILACNGFGGNRNMVNAHLPSIKDAVWFGHDGNRGEAMIWGQRIGADLAHMSAFQGHGNVAHPHGILITWATITEGGFQVNRDGNRFWNESQGYSEAAVAVLSQPGSFAWTIFDERIAATARQFDDFKSAEKQGAIVMASDLAELAGSIDLPKEALQSALETLYSGDDPYGRPAPVRALSGPFCAVRVTGALFHTQGGLCVDPDTALVARKNGGHFTNLHAAGGAACGVSGKGDSGYLSGNGLLSAVVLGRNAGRYAA